MNFLKIRTIEKRINVSKYQKLKSFLLHPSCLGLNLVAQVYRGLVEPV